MARDPLLFWKILQALGQTAVALNLAGIGDHVYLQIVPDNATGYSVANQQLQDVVFPAVLFSLEGDEESRATEDTGSKAWVFPARCWVADKNPLERHDKLPVYLGARKALFDAFDEEAGVTVMQAQAPPLPVVNVLVVPGVIFDPRLPQYQHIVSGFGLRVETQEDR